MFQKIFKEIEELSYLQQVNCNVTHHTKNYHPNVPKEEFLYDSKLKREKKGAYKTFEGYN